MSQDLDALYQEIILDHYKNPHHKGLRDPYEAEVHHVNPTCGDEVTLRVHLSEGPDGQLVEDVSYDALGCSISQASASVMTDLVIGKPVDEALAIHEEFLTLMQGRGTVEPDEERPDLLAFTGHKVVGPTGIGVLWGRRAVLDQLPPILGGGEMIETVTMEGSTYAPIPHKFEAGTPPIVEAVGLGAAVDYLSVLGMDNVHRHEQTVTAYALEGLATVPGLTVLGPLDATQRGGAISFEIPGVHPHDVATVLDSRGIAVRAGHHCAKPAHARFGVQSSTRMSSYLYTAPAEIDALVEGLEYTRRYFRLD